METQPMFDIPLLDEAAMQLANIKKKGPSDLILNFKFRSASGSLPEPTEHVESEDHPWLNL